MENEGIRMRALALATTLTGLSVTGFGLVIWHPPLMVLGAMVVIMGELVRMGGKE
jgi:hypothetical protein